MFYESPHRLGENTRRDGLRCSAPNAGSRGAQLTKFERASLEGPSPGWRCSLPARVKGEAVIVVAGRPSWSSMPPTGRRRSMSADAPAAAAVDEVTQRFGLKRKGLRCRAQPAKPRTSGTSGTRRFHEQRRPTARPRRRCSAGSSATASSRRVKTPVGEIDLYIAQRGDLVVFVEVKARGLFRTRKPRRWRRQSPPHRPRRPTLAHPPPDLATVRCAST